MRVAERRLLCPFRKGLVTQRPPPVSRDPHFGAVVLEHERQAHAPRNHWPRVAPDGVANVKELRGRRRIRDVVNEAALETVNVYLERHGERLWREEPLIPCLRPHENGLGCGKERHIKARLPESVHNTCDMADRAAGFQAYPQIRIDVYDPLLIWKREMSAWMTQQRPKLQSRVAARHLASRACRG